MFIWFTIISDCPNDIPKYEFKVHTSTVHQQTETDELPGNSEMSMSIEMDDNEKRFSKL